MLYVSFYEKESYTNVAFWFFCPGTFQENSCSSARNGNFDFNKARGYG